MQSLKLEKFKRLNEAIHPELLTDDELTKLEDMVLSEKFGKLRKRGGFAKFNANSIGGTMHSIYDIKADGGDNYILSGYGTGVYTSLNGTGSWSSIVGLSLQKFQLTPYASKFYLTDGVNALKVLGGTTLGNVWSLEITKPNISNISTGQNASGSLTASSMYKWVMTYVTLEGIESPPSQPFTHYDSSTKITTTATDKCIGFQDLPVSTDTRVSGRRIYRTLADSEIYYFHSQIDNTITTWFDKSPDSDLGSESINFLNAPQTAKYSCLHKERYWLANQTRLVKNWIMPAHSKNAGSFNVTFNSETIAFTAGGALDDCAVIDISPATGLSNGDYTYRIVFVDVNGLMSDYVTTNTVTVSATNKGIRIFYPPIVDSGYTEITTAFVYRKKDSGSYKYIGNYKANKVKSDTRIFDDANIADGSTYATNQTTDTELTGISFSEIAKPPCFILEDVRDIYPDDGDQITGIFDDVNGVLIFKEHSICKIFTEGSSNNWRLVKLIPNIGAEANTIAKWGNEYCFIYNKKFYKYNPHSGQLDQNIGELAKTSLAAVTTFHSATMSKTWYVLGVTGGSFTQSYGLFVYDFIAETWYKFNIYNVPYALAMKLHGTSSGSILLANGNFVLYYGTGTTDENTVAGTTVDVSPLVRTKNFGDGIVEIRARKIKFNYLKQDNKTTTIKVVNADTASVNTHTDSINATNSTDYKTLEVETGQENWSRANKFYFEFSGAGITEIDVFRFDFRVLKEGKAA